LHLWGALRAEHEFPTSRQCEVYFSHKTLSEDPDLQQESRELLNAAESLIEFLSVKPQPLLFRLKEQSHEKLSTK